MLNKTVFRNAKSEDSYLQEAGSCFYLFKHIIYSNCKLSGYFLGRHSVDNTAFLEKKNTTKHISNK